MGNCGWERGGPWGWDGVLVSWSCARDCSGGRIKLDWGRVAMCDDVRKAAGCAGQYFESAMGMLVTLGWYVLLKGIARSLSDG